MGSLLDMPVVGGSVFLEIELERLALLRGRGFEELHKLRRVLLALAEVLDEALASENRAV